jgi:hypothetical protein
MSDDGERATVVGGALAVVPSRPAVPTGADPGPPSRDRIAYHEAGHAAVGHRLGLTCEVIHVGDASGQVIFEEQWAPESVVRDAGLLDRYALMLLAGGHAERRYSGRVHGAQQDVETLERMLWEARRRGTVPNADPGRRSGQLVVERWAAIETLADELLHRGEPVGDPTEVVARYPHLGRAVTESRGERVRAVLDGRAAAAEGR